MASLKDKVEMYEGLLHDLHFCQVAMNEERIRELLKNISNWSYAHRVGNGELTPSEQSDRVNSAFERLRTVSK